MQGVELPAREPREEVVADVYARLRRPRSFDISMRRSKKTRMRPTTIFALALILALTACSQGTGILPAGPDTYTVTKHRAPVLGGAKEAQRVAMTEANDYCVQSGRKFFPLNMAEQAAVPAGGRCGIRHRSAFILWHQESAGIRLGRRHCRSHEPEASRPRGDGARFFREPGAASLCRPSPAIVGFRA